MLAPLPSGWPPNQGSQRRPQGRELQGPREETKPEIELLIKCYFGDEPTVAELMFLLMMHLQTVATSFKPNPMASPSTSLEIFK